MANIDINISQRLLKELEKGMSSFYNLSSQISIVSSNLEGTLIALGQTYKNWKREVEDSAPDLPE